jgi:hypothetical protein
MGLGYGWNLDFANPLTTISQGAKYVFCDGGTFWQVD